MSAQLDRLEIGCGYVYLNGRTLHGTRPGAPPQKAEVARIANEQVAMLNRRADEHKIPFELIDHRDGFRNRDAKWQGGAA